MRKLLLVTEKEALKNAAQRTHSELKNGLSKM
jgi:hypothetical protein